MGRLKKSTGCENNGGRRQGSGRKLLKVGFRQWCRDVVMHPEVLAALEQHARVNPEFALRVAEHGFGRAPQPMDVRVDDRRQSRDAVFDDAVPVFDEIEAAG